MLEMEDARTIRGTIPMWHGESKCQGEDKWERNLLKEIL